MPRSKPTAPAQTGNLVRITLDVVTTAPAFPAEVARWVAEMAYAHDDANDPDRVFVSIEPVAYEPRRR